MTPMPDGARNFSAFLLGFTGVELFFVLSGYLVGKIFLDLLRRNVSFSMITHFWTRRWFRTLPAYYLTLLLYVGLFYTQTHQFLFNDNSNLRYLVFFQNFTTPHPDFFAQAWSLSVEEWFYLLLPVWVILFYNLGKRKSMLTGILAFIVLIALLRVVIVLKYDPDWNKGDRMIVPLRLDSLMIGVLMAWLHIHYEDRWKKHTALLLKCGTGIILFSLAMLCFDSLDDHHVNGFFSKTFLFSFFSIGIACCLPFMSGVKSPGNKAIGAAVTYISVISYSLYLLDVLCILLVNNIYYTVFNEEIVMLKFVACWVGFFIAATLMYRFYERPFTNLRERFGKRK